MLPPMSYLVFLVEMIPVKLDVLFSEIFLARRTFKNAIIWCEMDDSEVSRWRFCINNKTIELPSSIISSSFFFGRL